METSIANVTKRRLSGLDLMYRMVLFFPYGSDGDETGRTDGRTGDVEAEAQSVGDRADGHPGDFYGGARYLDRQRVVAPHRRIVGGQPERGNVGHQLLPGGECGDSADQRIPGDAHRTQALLYDLRGHVRHQFAAMRSRALAWHAALLPRAA